MKAYGYVRVSSKGQIDGDGFNRQEQVIREYAGKHGYEIAQVFQEEGVSGTTEETDRPAFQEMVSSILKNGVRTVIIEGLDRLAREYRIQETLLIYLASKGITLISARTDENVTDAIMQDPMRKALVQIQGVFSELEKNLLVKKLRTARENKKAVTGKCEGRKGYSETEEGQQILKEIRKLRRRRKGQKQMTFNQVAEQLNEKGYRSGSGDLFSGNTVRGLMHRQRKK